MARPRLVTALSAASLLLSAAWAAVWARSYVRADVLAYVGRPAPEQFRRLEVASIVGVFSCDWSVVELDMAELTEMPKELARDGWGYGAWPYPPGDVRRRMPARRAFRLLDFALDHEPRVGGLADDGPAVRWERWSLGVPHWAIVLALAGPFLWRTRQRRLAASAAAEAAVAAKTAAVATPAAPSDPQPK